MAPDLSQCKPSKAIFACMPRGLTISVWAENLWVATFGGRERGDTQRKPKTKVELHILVVLVQWYLIMDTCFLSDLRLLPKFVNPFRDGI